MQEVGSRERQVTVSQKCTCKHLNAKNSAMAVCVQNIETYIKILR